MNCDFVYLVRHGHVAIKNYTKVVDRCKLCNLSGFKCKINIINVPQVVFGAYYPKLCLFLI